MGDRGNIAINQWGKDGPVVLYTHWSGSSIKETAARALDSKAGRTRWSDNEYLARIVFDVLTEGDHGGATGYGISTSLCDNEHPIVVIDPNSQRVAVRDEGSWKGAVGPNEGQTFEEFIAAYHDPDAG
jgi:hypothetical protein